MSFVELHARSAFSFLRGSSYPEDLVTRAAQQGMGCLAVADRDGVYGSARVHYKAKECGLRAIAGAELTMEDESVLPVVVLTRNGYQNLCRLLTRAHLCAAKGESRVAWQNLETYAEGLYALTGDSEGPLVHAMASGQREAPLAVLDRLKGIFGADRVAVEIQRHFIRGERTQGRALAGLATASGLPLVASNGPAYAERKAGRLLDAFTALRHHTTLDEARASPGSE